MQFRLNNPGRLQQYYIQLWLLMEEGCINWSRSQTANASGTKVTLWPPGCNGEVKRRYLSNNRQLDKFSLVMEPAQDLMVQPGLISIWHQHRKPLHFNGRYHIYVSAVQLCTNGCQVGEYCQNAVAVPWLQPNQLVVVYNSNWWNRQQHCANTVNNYSRKYNLLC